MQPKHPLSAMLQSAATQLDGALVVVNGRSVHVPDLMRAAVKVIETLLSVATKQAQLATTSIRIEGPEEAMALLRMMGRPAPSVVDHGGEVDQ